MIIGFVLTISRKIRNEETEISSEDYDGMIDVKMLDGRKAKTTSAANIWGFVPIYKGVVDSVSSIY